MLNIAQCQNIGNKAEQRQDSDAGHQDDSQTRWPKISCAELAGETQIVGCELVLHLRIP